MNMRYDPMLQWVGKRIQKNKNCIIVINGATGSGKTYAGIKFCIDIANLMGTNFSIENNMDFNFGKLLQKMESEDHKQPGTPFLFEEVGAVGGGAASREWQSKTNRFFHAFMQTSRHRQQILVMTCPSFSYLDKGARELCHTQWEMESIDFKNKTSTAKPYVLQVNRRTGKIYFKYLRFTAKSNTYKFSKIRFGLPPQDVLDSYEKLKNKYTTALNKKIIEGDEKKVKKNKTYPYYCSNCKYSWEARKENPKECPKCHNYNHISKKNGVMNSSNPIKEHSNFTSYSNGSSTPKRGSNPDINEGVDI